MFYHFKIHKDGKSYWAECVELKGCVTQADSKNELKINMEEALNLYLNEPDDSKLIFPLPRKVITIKNIEKVSVNPNVAFAFLLRRTRLKKNMTQAMVAEALGMKNLWSYQKLERGNSSNPALKTMAALKAIFPKLSIDQIFVHSKKSA